LDYSRGNAALSPDGIRVLTIIGDTVQVWEWENGHPFTRTRLGRGFWTASPDLSRVAVITKENTPPVGLLGESLQVWDTFTYHPLVNLDLRPIDLNQTLISSGGKYLIVGTKILYRFGT
jgi:hypothetical protein